VHADRTGKAFPSESDIPQRYAHVSAYAQTRFDRLVSAPAPWLGSILALKGTGKEIWAGQDPDDYVRSLREPWS